MSRSLEQRLQDILEAINKCLEYKPHLANSVSSEMASDAIIRNISIIGEAANHLPDDFKLQHSEIPWHQIIGMRNVLIHQYFGVTTDHVQDVIDNGLAPLETLIKQALQNNE